MLITFPVSFALKEDKMFFLLLFIHFPEMELVIVISVEIFKQ